MHACNNQNGTGDSVGGQHMQRDCLDLLIRLHACDECVQKLHLRYARADSEHGVVMDLSVCLSVCLSVSRARGFARALCIPNISAHSCMHAHTRRQVCHVCVGKCLSRMCRQVYVFTSACVQACKCTLCSQTRRKHDSAATTSQDQEAYQHVNHRHAMAPLVDAAGTGETRPGCKYTRLCASCWCRAKPGLPTHLALKSGR